MNFPIVTVITPVYNTGRFVLKGIDSLLEQTYPIDRIQHIIIDDGSTDDSITLIEEHLTNSKRYNVTFLKNDKNQGLCYSLNRGLELAVGKYVTLLPDDWWLPHKLEREIEVFEALPEDYAVLYTNVHFCDEENNIIKKSVVHNFAGAEDNAFEVLLKHQNFIFGPAAIMKKTCLEEVGHYDPSLLYEDYDMWLRLSTDYKFKYLAEANTVYRKIASGNSLSVKIQEPIYLFEEDRVRVKFLGKYPKYDEIILNRLVHNAIYYNLHEKETLLSLESLTGKENVLDERLLEEYRSKKMFLQYLQQSLKIYKTNKKINWGIRDFLYVVRQYYSKKRK